MGTEDAAIQTAEWSKQKLSILMKRPIGTTMCPSLVQAVESRLTYGSGGMS